MASTEIAKPEKETTCWAGEEKVTSTAILWWTYIGPPRLYNGLYFSINASAYAFHNSILYTFYVPVSSINVEIILFTDKYVLDKQFVIV